jgi:eukaryotic translation initiation factor 2C
MITTENIQSATIKLTKRWIETHREYPKNVYYFRDGVSEGQYQQVLDQEVRDLKAGFKRQWPNWQAGGLFINFL